ncbi:MAG TPA: hypothetical protein PLW37_08135 [bacterium]|jgi:hypothetical protein|nr:hypothetical protein [bacterium]HQB09821.1 hypothetical protein [bacterium]
MANTILLVFEGERTEVRIFNKIKQLLKFIPHQRIAVLSGIPLFVVDYFGEKFYETL